MFYCKTYLRYSLLLAILPKYANNTKDVKGRFHKDLDDEEWHVSHLRDLELGQECEDEFTFAEKARKYRKTLRNDGALVEFVSSNAIPFNPYDQDKDKCKDKKSSFRNPVIKWNNSTNNKNGEDSEVKTATVSSKAGVEDQKTLVEIKNQRRSEYQFSSVEYYDDVQDFDVAICPDDIEVINLEMDQLRNYYVECEAIVEWRSLE